jgi:hypothetical protein
MDARCLVDGCTSTFFVVVVHVRPDQSVASVAPRSFRNVSRRQSAFSTSMHVLPGGWGVYERWMRMHTKWLAELTCWG